MLDPTLDSRLPTPAGMRGGRDRALTARMLHFVVTDAFSPLLWDEVPGSNPGIPTDTAQCPATVYCGPSVITTTTGVLDDSETNDRADRADWLWRISICD